MPIRKTILLILTIAIVLFFLWAGFLWKFFSSGFAGSYPYVETYDLKASQKELFEAIKEIKREHPELQPPGDTAYTVLPSDKDGDFDVRFFYNDTKEIVHTFIDTESDTTLMQLALYGYEDYENKPIQDTQTTKNWRLINKDFAYFRNRSAIKKFEQVILTPIKQKLKNSSS